MAFLDDTFRALCGSQVLAAYRMCAARGAAAARAARVCPKRRKPDADAALRRSVRGVLGEALWAEDPVPDYSAEAPPIHPALSTLVRLRGARETAREPAHGC